MPVNKKAINDKGQTKTSMKEDLDKSKCGNNMNDKWGINRKEDVNRKMKERFDRSDNREKEDLDKSKCGNNMNDKNKERINMK